MAEINERETKGATYRIDKTKLILKKSQYWQTPRQNNNNNDNKTSKASNE